MNCITGWSLGEHQEWSKYSNYEVATQVPLLVYMPGSTYTPEKNRPIFPYKSALALHGSNKYKIADKYHNRNEVLHSDAPFGHNSISQRNIMQTSALVELVDIFPSLVDLVGINPIQMCPEESDLTLCSEGLSFSKLIKDKPSKSVWKTAAFSQYPRPSFYPQEDSDKPRLADIEIMGYSMRTQEHRYTEWVGFDPHTFQQNWTDVKSKELYILAEDPFEDHNLAEKPLYASLVEQLSNKLRLGWRCALPQL